MSGYDAFLSFANFMKDRLVSSGIGVGIEKEEVLTPPYLRFQIGPDQIRNEWLSSQMIQAWLVVQKNDTEPLVVTYGKALKQVLAAGQDVGHIPKYDYSQTPNKQIGTLIPKLFGQISSDLSNDAKLEKHVITWILHSGM